MKKYRCPSLWNHQKVIPPIDQIKASEHPEMLRRIILRLWNLQIKFVSDLLWSIRNDNINRLDDGKRSPITELTTPNAEDDFFHDSTTSPNNPKQPPSQSSSEIPLEVSTNPNFGN
ncbi:hypothetical protein Fot_03744 [Forsythia ovata]|uniref:Uncharacterized protein n=1 Tax=Forsythia ovata TaxID=205694 RepID=A0ABD1XAJ9_9LAMI